MVSKRCKSEQPHATLNLCPHPKDCISHSDCVQHSGVYSEPPKAEAARINSSICSSVVLNVAQGCQLGSHLHCGAPF